MLNARNSKIKRWRPVRITTQKLLTTIIVFGYIQKIIVSKVIH